MCCFYCWLLIKSKYCTDTHRFCGLDFLGAGLGVFFASYSVVFCFFVRKFMEIVILLFIRNIETLLPLITFDLQHDDQRDDVASV